MSEDDEDFDFRSGSEDDGFYEDEVERQQEYDVGYNDQGNYATMDPFQSTLNELVPPDTDPNASRFKTLEQRFALGVAGFITKLSEEDGVPLGKDVSILKRIHSIPIHKRGALNPYAFVLGYMASNGGSSLEKKQFNSVIARVLEANLVPEDAGVRPEDVLRYARYWTLVLS